jgi:hypothetical protein
VGLDKICWTYNGVRQLNRYSYQAVGRTGEGVGNRSHWAQPSVGTAAYLLGARHRYVNLPLFSLEAVPPLPHTPLMLKLKESRDTECPDKGISPHRAVYPHKCHAITLSWVTNSSFCIFPKQLRAYHPIITRHVI